MDIRQEEDSAWDEREIGMVQFLTLLYKDFTARLKAMGLQQVKYVLEAPLWMELYSRRNEWEHYMFCQEFIDSKLYCEYRYATGCLWKLLESIGKKNALEQAVSWIVTFELQFYFHDLNCLTDCTLKSRSLQRTTMVMLAVFYMLFSCIWSTGMHVRWQVGWAELKMDYRRTNFTIAFEQRWK